MFFFFFCLETSIINLTEKGYSCSQIAKSLSLAHSTIQCVRKRLNLGLQMYSKWTSQIAHRHRCRTYRKTDEKTWKRVIWSDETKIYHFQSDRKEYFWHRPYENLQRHQVKQTVKHGGGELMVWGCFTWWNVGPFFKVEGVMRKEDYLNTFQTNLPAYVEKSPYPEENTWFQQDGDPKHTDETVKNRLFYQNFN